MFTVGHCQLDRRDLYIQNVFLWEKKHYIIIYWFDIWVKIILESHQSKWKKVYFCTLDGKNYRI